MSEFSYIYDLESLSEPERQDYVQRLCRHLNIASDIGLIMLGRMQDPQGGPARLVPWIKRGGTEQIRNDRRIDIIDTKHSMIGADTIMFTVTGKDKDGRQEIAIGAKSLTGLSGEQMTDAIQAANTRANQRMTLQFVGAGLLSESEVQGRIVNAPAGAVSKLQLAETKPNNLPGITVTTVPCLPTEPVIGRVNEPTKCGELEDQEKIKESWREVYDQVKREQAIAQLNENVIPEKRPRKRAKKVIDLGSSEPVSTVSTVENPESAAASPSPIPAPVEAAPVVQPPASPAAVPGKPRLTPEQVKPFRTRLFRLVNDYLEVAGFVPKEGMGNADKMRALATIQFPDVKNLNELTEAQWETYLSNLEQRVQKDGAEAVVKYIEESIGL